MARKPSRRRTGAVTRSAALPRWSQPLRDQLPLILIRGFGGLSVEDEKRIAYQGFNDGTVYPHKRGENYIYEGLILRFMKSDLRYRDATNVVGYYGQPVRDALSELPESLRHLDPAFFRGHKVVIDAGMADRLVRSDDDPWRTLWVFRYYDLNDRQFALYGEALVRLIDFIRAVCVSRGSGAATNGSPPKVNIIAHSMGGLIVREAVQVTYDRQRRDGRRRDAADDCINKIVTLGTPHKGISFQVLDQWLAIEPREELERFNPDFQRDASQPAAYVNFARHFDPGRVLTIVGTNYRSYGVRTASWLNRLFAAPHEYGPNYNRSDGLVKQAFAQLPGAYRTFVHKCHGGPDSLVTSREAFEIATRFFSGNLRVRLRLIDGLVKRGMDMFGRSELFLGVSIKPRGVDFDLFHQSAEAENCYGPFRQPDLSDDAPAFNWAGDNRLIWEGFLDASKSTTGRDIVIRLDVYLGERDLLGIGFSDNVILRKQCYIRASMSTEPRVQRLFLHEEEGFMRTPPDEGRAMTASETGWEFALDEPGFAGRFGVEIDHLNG